ncbi:MAG TPA: 50S ribosomal protein L21 [Blastocatellia bacterium]|nr:50S ribosomal protein L21 [Blastocatellia bacterium]
MGYAIIQTGGKQFSVREGDLVEVPSLDQKPGSDVEFEVLLYSAAGHVDVGSPVVPGSRAKGTVVAHGRGKKVLVLKKKKRKHYKKMHGHRQNFTAVRIDSIGGPQAVEEAGAGAQNQDA